MNVAGSCPHVLVPSPPDSKDSSFTLTSAKRSIQTVLREDYVLTNNHIQNLGKISSSSHTYEQSWHKPNLQRCSLAKTDVTELRHAIDVECIERRRLGRNTEKRNRKKASCRPETIVERSLKKTVEQLLKFLDEKEQKPSVHELLAILYKCRAAKESCHILRFYAFLRAQRLDTHSLLGKYLVLTLAESGKLQDALELFNRLHDRDQSTWNSLITGFVKFGDVENAFILYTSMCADGTVKPSKHTIVALLKACARLKDIERGCQLHADIKEIGQYMNDEFIGSALIDMYAKCSLVQKALDVFDTLLSSDVVAWNALIGGYAIQGYSQQALDCFKQMQTQGVLPNAVTFVCIMKACANSDDTRIGDELHSHIIKLGPMENNIVVSNAVLEMYAKRGCLTTTCIVFDKLDVRDVFSWTSLLNAYVNSDLNEEALACFETMQVDGVSPNTVTYALGLKACAQMEAADSGRKIHSELVCKGLEKDHAIGIALIGMYAKCGAFNIAEGLFDTLVVQDVVSWNLLIVGYLKHDNPAEALRCYKQMRENGISPDAVTLACCLRACGLTKAVDRGKELHAEIAGRGLMAQDTIIGNALVEMYAKCGLLEKAQDVFDRLPIHTVISWNTLISGYAGQDRGEEVMKCFKRMQVDGVYPDAVTYFCCLGVCGSMKNLDQGKKLHDEASVMGLTQDQLVINALVDMYCKCGSLEKAEEVFYCKSHRDVVCWTSLIGGCVELGCSDKALACFRQMQQEAISPDALAFAYILKACGNAQEDGQGLELHALIIGVGWEGDVIVINALVYMYAKFGRLAQAQKLFDSLTSRDVVSWNILIAGYDEHGHEERALMCFEEMQMEGVHPVGSTYISLLKVNCTFRAPNIIRQIYAMVIKEGQDTECAIGTALVNAFSKCGLLADAEDVFNKIPIRDGVLWTSIIAAYVEHDQGEDALRCLHLMEQERFPWDVVTFACSLQACGGLGALIKGQELHDQISKEGLLQDENVLIRALMDMYAKCGMIQRAMHIFGKLHDQSVVAWSTLIAGFAQFGKVESVLHLVNKMTTEGKVPNSITYLSLLNACAHAGMISSAQMYLECMEIKHGAVATLEHYNCIVDLLSRAGQVEEALGMIEYLSFNCNHVVLQTFSSACEKWGYIDQGKELHTRVLRMHRDSASSFVYVSKMYADAAQELILNKTRIN